MNCLIYSRVSTEEQAETGRSIDDQIKICDRFAKDNDYSVVGIYKDPGKSATNMNRPGLQDLILRCQDDRNIDAVMVQDTDRLARNEADHLQIKAMLKKVGAKVISVSQPMLDDSTPEGQFMDLVIAGVNAFQSRITGRKVGKCMLEKFREGWWPSLAYFGYKNMNAGTSDQPKNIIGNDEEKQVFIKKAFKMFATGLYSADEVNDDLYKQGFTTKGNKKIASSQFNRILKNPFYYGLMRFRGEERIGLHKPIISKELFDQCQNIIAEHNLGANRNRKYNFLLRGFVYCGICGHRFTADHHISKKKSYYHCSGDHSNKKQNVIARDLEARVEQLFEQIQLPQSFVEKLLARAKELLMHTRQDIDGERRQLTLRKIKLENKRDVLEQKLLEGVIDNEVYRRLHDPLVEEIKRIDEMILNLNSDRKSNIDVFEKFLLLARDIGKAYKQAPDQVKRHYLGLFWDRIEVKNRKIKKAVPTKLYQELFPQYNFALRQNALSDLIVRGTECKRAWWGSNPRRSP